MGKILYVLIVEDSIEDAELLVIELQKNGYQIEWERVENKDDFESSLCARKWDIVLSDFVMQGFTGLDALRIHKKNHRNIPFILVSGSIGEEMAIEVMREGANDYIMKEKMMRLGPAVKRELRDAKIRNDHQKAIDAVQASEEEWRSTFNAISDSVSIISFDGKILNTNKASLSFFDISIEACLGRDFWSLMPDLDQTEHVPGFKESLRLGNQYKLQIFSNNKWFLVSFDPIKDNNGASTAVMVIKDITEERLANKTLVDSEARFRALSNATNEAVFISQNGICIETNMAACDMFGLSYEEMIGVFGTDIVAPESKELVKKNILSRHTEPYEAFGLRKDGSVFYGEFVGKMYQYKGDIVRITTVRDLSKQKSAEKALTRSLKELEALSNNLPLGIYRTRIGGNIIKYNPAFAKIMGYEKEDLSNGINSNVFYKDPYDRVKFVELINQKHRVSSYQARLVRKDGTEFWASINAQIMFDESGTPEFMDGIIEDITERRKIQNELVSAKEKAEESDRLKSAFLANMSHEIRTPMNAILGFSELLAEPDIEKSEQLNCIDLIQSNGNVLLRIIEDIIDIARIEAGELNIQMEQCNIDESLMSIIRNTKNTVQRQRKKLKVEFCPDPRLDTPLLTTDVARFKQIFTNLIDNAEKFTQKGKIECGYAMVDIEPTKSVMRFYVKDTGIGIPSDKLDLIFDRFRQVDDSHTRLFGGTGLGLAITRKLVATLGGTIKVESEEGTGSVFWVELPYQHKEVINGSSDGIHSKKKQAVDWSDKVFLVVEDVASNFLYLDKLMKTTGVKLIWAEDGREAIEKYDAKPDVDLVIMDVNLPVINGLEVTRYIRTKDKNIPIVAQTAYARESDRKSCMDAGCNAFVTKPIRKKIFFETLARFLE